MIVFIINMLTEINLFTRRNLNIIRHNEAILEYTPKHNIIYYFERRYKHNVVQ